MIAHDPLVDALGPHLSAQRWFAGQVESVDLVIDDVTVLRSEWPALVRVLVIASGTTWQVLLGLRPVDQLGSILDGKPTALVGTLATTQGDAIVYDATVDHELSLHLLHHVAPHLSAERHRPLGAEQSNTSVVFDERLVLKVFRQLGIGPNDDIEVAEALGRVGFANIPRLVAAWREGDRDFGVVSDFLAGAVDGFHLALTSVHDLLASRVPPADAGGDFAPDARRLGAITAELHLALARAFGASPSVPSSFARDMASQLERSAAALPPRDVAAVRAIYAALHDIDMGPAIRIHGDFHLGQAMRTDAGWYVVDFEGEPDRPRDERARPSCALRDVAGMLRSFHYAAEVGVRDFGYAGDAESRLLAIEWEQRNGRAFLNGYQSAAGIRALLPPDPRVRQQVLEAFLVDKAVYEVGYEASHRPDWVGIPLSAIDRILEGAVPT